MNQITAQSAPKNSPPMDRTRAMADLTDLYRMRVRQEGRFFSISDRQLPSPAERNALACRRDELQAAMGGTGKPEIAARVARLFLRFPSAGKADAEATTAAYATDLMGYPLWAIDRGIMKAIESWKSAFAPSSPELRAMVADAVKPYSDELRDLTAILDAEVFHEPDDGERAKVAGQFAALIADLGIHAPIASTRFASAKDAAEAWLEANKAMPLPQLSTAALERFGIDALTGRAA